MQKITTFLWYDGQAEEAAQLYTSLFKNSKIQSISRYQEGTPGMPGTVMTVNFELDGQEFIALNGGPEFKFTEAISLMAHCDSQEEVDRLWEKLTENGGEESQCGWLKDRFGVSWQIVPDEFLTLMNSGDPERSQRVMQAMLKMKKLDLAILRKAYEGDS
jgi:predicted 3-demethylubiquinone-9 3-methyltransferase (glyoxalase superfamily)